MIALYSLNFQTRSKFGAAAFDAQINDVIYKEVINERGLEHSANGFWNQIAQQGRGFSDVLNEVLDIEIEAWKRTYNIS